MSEHVGIMEMLMESRERRAIKRDIKKLGAAEVISELEIRGFNISGSDAVRRDRLVRAVLRENEPNNDLIPWYEWDYADFVEENRDIEESVVAPAEQTASMTMPKKRGRPRKVNNEEVAHGERSNASSPLHSEPERNQPLEIIADVHVPASSAHTTISTATVTTTTSSINMAIPVVTAPMLASANFITAGAARTSARAPIRVATPEMQEYFYAQLYRSTRVPMPLEARPVQPNGHEPLHVDRNNRDGENWYTPAQNLNEIRRAPSVSSQNFAESQENLSEILDDEQADGESVSSFITSRNNYLRSERERSARDYRERCRQQKREAALQEELAYYKRLLNSQRPVYREEPETVRFLSENNQALNRESINRQTGVSGVDSRGNLNNSRAFRENASNLNTSSSDTNYSPVRIPVSNANTNGVKSNSASVAPREKNDGKTSKAVKHLKYWGLKFTGEGKDEDPEEFIDELNDCRDGAEEGDKDLLKGLPSIFSKSAGRWFRATKSKFNSWEEFEAAFRKRFIKEYRKEDLMNELRQRTQGKGEEISVYLSNIRYIVSRFKEPPTEAEQLEIVQRNLLPEYKKAMFEKLIESLDELETYGHRWEDQKDLNSRYEPPPPAEKMRVKRAILRRLGELRRPHVEESERAKDYSSAKTRTNVPEVIDLINEEESQEKEEKTYSGAHELVDLAPETMEIDNTEPTVTAESPEEMESRRAESELKQYIATAENRDPKEPRQVLRVPLSREARPLAELNGVLPIESQFVGLMAWDLGIEDESEANQFHRRQNAVQAVPNTSRKTSKLSRSTNPNRQLTMDDYESGRDDSRTRSPSPLGPNNLVRREPSTPPSQEREPRRRRVEEGLTRREAPRLHRHWSRNPEGLPVRTSGVMFGGLERVRMDPNIDSPPFSCFNCWERGHSAKRCPLRRLHVHCFNCGRSGVDLKVCPRCSGPHRRFIATEFANEPRGHDAPGRTSRANEGERNRARPRRPENSQERLQNNVIATNERPRSPADNRRPAHEQNAERRGPVWDRLGHRVEPNPPVEARAGNEQRDPVQDALRLIEGVQDLSTETREAVLRGVYQNRTR